MMAGDRDYGRADWERVAGEGDHTRYSLGSLLLILGTTMQFGYGPVQTLLTASNMPPSSDMIRWSRWSRVLLSHTVDAARSY